jgi:hypothetical protein
MAHLAPHQQPTRADDPNPPTGATPREKAVDARINNICRGC